MASTMATGARSLDDDALMERAMIGNACGSYREILSIRGMVRRRQGYRPVACAYNQIQTPAATSGRAMLTINEIFHSIQGESTFAGRPCVFVRLTACDLRCTWCDTAYAFHEGGKRSIDDILAEVERFNCPLVEVTGGEPLLQEGVYPLMERLVASGRTVLIETGGHRSTARVPEAVVTVLDVKCPGSGEAGRMDWSNLERLRPHDEVKFVIADRADYEYAQDVVARYQLAERAAAVHFSPVHGLLHPRQLSEWVLADRLPVRVQLQVHKVIWPAEMRGV